MSETADRPRPRCPVVLAVHGTNLQCQLYRSHDSEHMAITEAANTSQRLWRWTSDYDATEEPVQRDLIGNEAWADEMPEPEDGAA